MEIRVMFGGPLNFIAIFLSFGRLLTIRKNASVSSQKRTRQTYIQSNAELQAKMVVVVVWRAGEAIRQKGRLGGRPAGSTFIGRPSEK
jgi:hypothetical protein